MKNIERLTIWTLNPNTLLWIKRRRISFQQWKEANSAAELHQQFTEQHKGHKAVFIPEGIDPNHDKAFSAMQQLTEKHCQSYKTDFYGIDSIFFYQYNRRVIWTTRTAGTNLQALEYDEQQAKEISIKTLEYYLQQEKSRSHPDKVYLIENDKVKLITYEKALEILQAAKVNEPQTV
jgi:hypothetical protein